MTSHSVPVTECTTHSPCNFDAKINNWAEGLLITIDADNSTFTIRGAKRAYASEYAKMLKVIREKTENMVPSDRTSKTAEIRLAWKSPLEKAHAEEAETESDITFRLPGKSGILMIVDETPFYNREKFTGATLNSVESLTEKERNAIHAFKDLKVGERVVIGYESGLIRNDAYVLIKAH